MTGGAGSSAARASGAFPGVAGGGAGLTAGALRLMMPRARQARIRLGAAVNRRLGGAPMARGKVKWFNDSKGYGFIAQPSGKDVFVHFSSIEGAGFRTLAEGEEVEFEAETTDRGLQATHVLRA